MRRIARYAMYGLAGLAIVAILAGTAGLLLVQTAWFHEKVRERIVYEIEKATGGRVELQRFAFDWHTLIAEVRGLVLHGTESAGEAPLFRADTVRVGLKVVSLLEKRVDLESVEVLRPRVNLIVYPDGRTNLPGPKVPRTRRRGTLDTILDLAIKRFRITDGTVQAQMQRVPLDALGENFRAQVLYEPEPARYRASLAFRSLNVQAGRLKPRAIDVDANVVLERDRLQIGSLQLAASGVKVQARGAVESFASPRAELAYTLRADLKDALPEVDLGPFPHRGMVAFDGRATMTAGSPYQVSGRLAVVGMAFRERGIAIENIRVNSGVTITPGRADFANLTVDALRGRFAGRGEMRDWRDFRVQGAVQGFALHDLTRVEGVHRMTWSGGVSGPLQLTGALRAGKLAALRLNTRLEVLPAEGENPVHGLIDLAYDHAGRELAFGPSRLDTRFSRIHFSGVLGREVRAGAETTNIDDAQPAIAMFRTGPPPVLPVSLAAGGTAKFEGVVSGPIRNPVISGHATATRFIVTGREFDRGEADAVINRSGVTTQNVAVSRGGLRATGSVQVAFRNWSPEPQEPLSGSFAVRSPKLEDALAAANLKSPVEVSSAGVTATGKLAGTIGKPEVSGHVDAAGVVFEGQALDRVQGEMRYSGDTLEVSGVQIDRGASHLLLNARYDHAAGNWSYGRGRFDAASRGILLGGLQAAAERVPGLEGRIETQMAGEVSLDPSGFRPGAFNGWVGVRGLAVGGEQMGSLLVTATTKGTRVAVGLEGDLAGSKLTGSSDWSLEGKYAASGQVNFTTLQFSALLARLRRKPSAGEPPINGSITGALRFSGNTTEPTSWKASLELPGFEVRPAAGLTDDPTTSKLVLRNEGPVLVDLDAQGARVRQARFRGKNTNLTVSGRIGFKTRNPLDIRVQGGVNLELLHDFEDQINSTGSLVMDVSVRGALERPDIYGRIDLRNASLNLVDFPNGIDNANGVIFLYRDRAMIETLTAESGGGQVAATGFISFGETATFNLKAKATDVRVRYPEGVSSTSNGELTFTGTLDRSVLAGEVTITRVGFNPRSDLGTILENASQPVETPAQPGRFRQGLRFDVRIITAPQAQFVTKLTKDVQADANLRLRGSGTHPVALGRVMINQGDVMFFGNKYTINSGQILFVNAAKIEPTVSLDLQTRARGVEVTLHVSGPVNKLNVSYRSDPPLSFSDIVALLTTGRDPGLTPGLSGSQSQIGQNWQQAGASALVTQAIASPIAGRLQRFFGVSRLKIDPQITGLSTSNAAARLTLEQNITNNLTLTYITDLSRAQAQSVRLELDFNRNWSGVAVREENGQFGIDFLYRKQLK